MTIIDEHEHVIDCIKFAPEAACKTIQMADYNKLGAVAGVDGSGDIMDDSTGDNTRGLDDTEMIEEAKRLDGDTTVDENRKMTTREKVAKLKEDLKKRKAMLRGELQE